MNARFLAYATALPVSSALHTPAQAVAPGKRFRSLAFAVLLASTAVSLADEARAVVVITLDSPALQIRPENNDLKEDFTIKNTGPGDITFTSTAVVAVLTDHRSGDSELDSLQLNRTITSCKKDTLLAAGATCKVSAILDTIDNDPKDQKNPVDDQGNFIVFAGAAFKDASGATGSVQSPDAKVWVVDNPRVVSGIPEPPALALLTSGLVALVAIQLTWRPPRSDMSSRGAGAQY